jgi:hypothetical protein
MARVNACSLRETPEDRVVAWDFFRRTYLFTQPSGSWYGDDLVESPDFHYQLVHSSEAHDFNVWACPRGYGKSTVIDEMVLLTAVTQPGYPQAICLASDRLVSGRVSKYMEQLADNQELVEDFGDMRPANRTGYQKWNSSMLHLNNGARIVVFPVGGRKRGINPRPRRIFLDDPEFDASHSTDLELLRKQFETLLFRVLFPMGQKGTKFFWTGTMITKQSSLWTAISGEDTRFRLWNRRVVDVDYTDEEGTLRSSWEEMNSVEDLERLEELMGSGAYGAEYRNKPGEGMDSTFVIDSEFNSYEIRGDIGPSPYDSEAEVIWTAPSRERPDGEQQKTPLRDLLRQMYVILTMDYAPTISETSDYSAVMVLGFQRPMDVLWVLDGFVGKVREEQLVAQVYRLGSLWKARVVGVEAVGMQNRLVEVVDSFLMVRAGDGKWYPRVVPVKYPPSHDKSSRIMGMRWRFPTGRIKLPLYRRSSDQAMRMLTQQISDFQGDLLNGNLRHDDAIDALAMYQYTVRSRMIHALQNEPTKTLVDQLSEGALVDEASGLPLLSGLNADEVPIDVWNKMMATHLTVAEDDEDGPEPFEHRMSVGAW